MSEPISTAAHRLCAALHADNIDPADVVVLLPRDAWWRLQTRLEQLYSGFMKFDGRGLLKEEFQYMGITFRVKTE